LSKDKILLNPAIDNKTNLILIGDSLSDLSIIKNLKFEKYNLLKIGFFNRKNLKNENTLTKY